MTTAAADLTPAWAFPRCRPRMHRLASILAATYRTPDLGNLPDPLDEAIFILLTYQTDLARARGVFADLKRRFPGWGALMNAPAPEVQEILRPSGLQRARCRIIRSMLADVHGRFGVYSLDKLRAMTPDDAETLLRRLPGLDLKGARCVALYSLGHAAFPIDSNTFRFMQRYGVLSRKAKYRRRSVHDGLQQLVPHRDRYRLHVNLVVHGQTICLPRTPRCAECCLRRTCKSRRSTS
jgi:endonuclease III